MATGNLADPLATKRKLPGDPANPDAMTGGMDLGAGGAAPIGDPRAITNTQPLGPGAGGPAPPVGDPQGTSLAPAATTQAPAGGADPFAAAGGGQYFGDTGQWIPNNNEAALTAARARTGQVAPTDPAAPIGPVGDPRRPGNPNSPDALAPAPLPGVAETTTTAPAPYKDALLKMLGDSQTPASLGDPALKAQSDAYAVGQQRSTEQARSAMAERAAQNGGTGVNSGAFDQGLAGLFGQQGEAQGAFNAGLVGDAAKSKLAQMQSALSMMGSDINSEQGRALQKQIADTQAQIQREGLKQNESQFGRSLTQSGSQFDTDAALRRLGITSQTDLGNRDLSLKDKFGTAGLNAQIMQMLMNNKQFQQSESGTNARFGAGLNQQALLQMLGGL